LAIPRYDRREQANAAIEAMNDYTPHGAHEPIKVKLAENHGKQKASYVAGFQAGYSQNSRGRGGGVGSRF
jgi:protein sex-lethal